MLPLGSFPKGYDLESRSNREACVSYSGEDRSSTRHTQINCVLALMVIMSECIISFSVRSPIVLMDIGLIAGCVGVALDHDVGSGAAGDACK